MNRKMEVAVRKGDISGIKNLIAKFSQDTYAKLPMSYQTMCSVEDLISLGTIHSVTRIVKLYRANTGRKKKFVTGKVRDEAQFITYAYKALDNLYKDILKEAYREKRVAKIYSMDTKVSYKGIELDLHSCVQRLKDKVGIEDSIINRIDAEKAFVKVYKLASPKLRRHLMNWCIQPKITKYKLNAGQFKAAVREYRKAGFGNILLPEYIKTIQNDAICRNRVVLATLGLPVVTDTKRRIIKYKGGFQTVIRKNQPTLEEQMLSDALIEGAY